MKVAQTTAGYPRALAHLSGERNLAADAAMALALPHMMPHAQTEALGLLFQRGHDPSLARVVARFDRMRSEPQAEMVARIRELFGAVRLAVGSPAFEDRAAAIALITRSRKGSLAYLLADCLRSRCVKTRQLAAQALHRLTDELLHATHTGRLSIDHAECQPLADGLSQALDRAIATWEIHFQPAALEAAVWMGDRVHPAITRRLAERQSKLARALNHLLEGVSDPRLAGFSLRALAVPPLRSAAAQAIGQAEDPAFARALLEASWLLADDEIERGCRWIRGTGWLDALAADLSRLEPAEAAGAARLLAASGGSNETKMERFRELALLDAPDLRHAVVAQLVLLESEAATDVLRTIAARGRDDAARFASRELRRRRADSPAKPESEPASPDDSAAVRAWRAFERYWEEYDELDQEDRAALTEAMKPLAENLLVPIRAKLASTRPRERARTLQLARAFGVASALEEQVYRHAHDTDAVVRSLAVAMLADLAGPTSVRILRAAMNDPDARVQANALEALERLDVRDRADYTTGHLDADNARVRANAIKSLLRLNIAQAAEELLSMLADPQPGHRLSALWVVERLQLRALVRLIEKLSDSDPDEKVRRRAARILRVLPAEALRPSASAERQPRATIGDAR